MKIEEKIYKKFKNYEGNDMATKIMDELNKECPNLDTVDLMSISARLYAKLEGQS